MGNLFFFFSYSYYYYFFSYHHPFFVCVCIAVFYFSAFLQEHLLEFENQVIRQFSIYVRPFVCTSSARNAEENNKTRATF